MRVCVMVILALLAWPAGSTRVKLSFDTRSLIEEIGDAADKHDTAVPCPTKATDFTKCFRTSSGAVDFPWGAPEISYPIDGSPWGVHLTGPYPDGVTYLVSWYTGGPTVGFAPTQPDTKSLKTYASVTPTVNGTVEDGTAPTSFEGSIITYLRLFAPTDTKKANYSYLSPYIHHVVLTNLLPSTTYLYQVSSRNGSLAGSYNFTTLPIANDSDDTGSDGGEGASSPYPLRIGIMGDVGQTRNSSVTRDHMMANKPQVVLHVGDTSYADNYGASNPNQLGGVGGTNQQRWDSWAVLWEPLLANVPMLNLPGNHETETSGIKSVIGLTTTSWSFPTNYPFQSFASRFPSPGATGATFGNITANMYYSTVLGGVAKLISMNNYIAFHPGSRQYVWAVNELKNVNRTKTPWLFVQFHTSVYHTYANHYKEMECFRSIWESIFKTYGVDMVFSGHVHAYERTHPVYDYKRDSCAPIYLTIGDGGNVEGLYRTFVDDIKSGTNTTQCESLTIGGLSPAQMYYTKPSGWSSAGPRPSNCPTLSFQPASGINGGPPVMTLNGTEPLLGFCQSSQPVWSALRDPSFGHAILTITSPTTATFKWFKNLVGTAVAVDSVDLVRPANCANRRRSA